MGPLAKGIEEPPVPYEQLDQLFFDLADAFYNYGCECDNTLQMTQEFAARVLKLPEEKFRELARYGPGLYYQRKRPLVARGATTMRHRSPRRRGRSVSRLSGALRCHQDWPVRQLRPEACD